MTQVPSIYKGLFKLINQKINLKEKADKFTSRKSKKQRYDS